MWISALMPGQVRTSSRRPRNLRRNYLGIEGVDTKKRKWVDQDNEKGWLQENPRGITLF